MREPPSSDDSGLGENPDFSPSPESSEPSITAILVGGLEHFYFFIY